MHLGVPEVLRALKLASNLDRLVEPGFIGSHLLITLLVLSNQRPVNEQIRVLLPLLLQEATKHRGELHQ